MQASVDTFKESGGVESPLLWSLMPSLPENMHYKYCNSKAVDCEY